MRMPSSSASDSVRGPCARSRSRGRSSMGMSLMMSVMARLARVAYERLECVARLSTRVRMSGGKDVGMYPPAEWVYGHFLTSQHPYIPTLYDVGRFSS